MLLTRAIAFVPLCILLGVPQAPAFDEVLTLSPETPVAGEAVTAHLVVWLPEPCFDIGSEDIVTQGADHSWDMTLTRQPGACVQVIVSVELVADIEVTALGENTLTVNQLWESPWGTETETLTFTFEAISPASVNDVLTALLIDDEGSLPCDLNGDGWEDVADLVCLINRDAD